MKWGETAVFFLILPAVFAGAAWESADVPPDLQPPGSAVEDPAGTWTVSGAGVDIWGTSDEFHFLYVTEPYEGDFAVSCHVVNFGGTTSAWGKAGLMARWGSPDFLGPESYAFCFASTNNGACLQWRDGNGTNAAWNGAVNQRMVGPEDVWLKLLRRGDTFYGYVSTQPPFWFDLGSWTFANVPPGEGVYVGLAVTSHEAGVLATAVFDAVDLEDPGISESPPTALSCSVEGDSVLFSWKNSTSYDEIMVFRQDTNGVREQISPSPDPTAESFTDKPGDGFWVYWLVAVEDEAPCPPLKCGPVYVGEAEGYAAAVLPDGPIAYWRLNDGDPTAAVNLGALGSAVDGTYVGGVELEAPGLLPNGEDAAVYFNGIDAVVTIPDNSAINTGGPYEARTIELWFQAEEIGPTPGMIYEEGGTTRGLNIYVIEVSRRKRLYINGWNRNQNEGLWGPLYANTEIETGVPYHLVMVFKASENDVFGDRDGRITGYLNGEEFKTVPGADRLFAHSDDIAIGGVAGNTYLHNYQGTSTAFFTGTIDEVALYDYALDDPNGDGDRSDSRVAAHYRAGAGGTGEVTFIRGDTNADGNRNIADAIFILTYNFGGGEAPPCMDSADANDDGGVNIADSIAILGYLFGGEGDLPPPFGACGTDPTEDDLTCEAFQPCLAP